MAYEYVPYDGPIVTRRDAKNLGLTRYFNGKPCNYGHISQRMTKCAVCCACSNINRDNWTKSNKEKCREAVRRYSSKNREVIRLRSVANRIKFKERDKARRRESIKLRKPQWKAQNAKRRAAKRNALPKWADKKQIAKIYKDCPEGYEVDHFYPLTSDFVCGLHVENNLVCIPIEENRKKANKMPEEFYGG